MPPRRRGVVVEVEVEGERNGVGSLPIWVAGAAGVTMSAGLGWGDAADGGVDGPGAGAGALEATPWNCMLRLAWSDSYILSSARCVSFESRMRGLTSTRRRAGLIA